MKHNYIKLMLPVLLGIASLNTLAHNFEVDGIYYNITSSEDLTVAVTYKGSNYNSYSNDYSGQVTIPETVTYNEKTYRVTCIGFRAFYNCEGLTSITIPNSVTSIENEVFFGCNGLTTPVYNDKLFAFMPTNATGNYTIPNGIETVAPYAFYGCNKLSSVTLTNSIKTVGYCAFGSTKLNTLIVGTGVLTFSNSFRDSNGNYYRPIKTIWLTNTPPTNYTEAQGTVNYVANSQYGSLNNIKEYKFLSSTFDVNGVKYVPVSPSDRTCDAIDCIYDETMTEVNINATVTYKGINLKVLNVQPYTFYENINLQKASFDIAGGLGKYVFYGCNNLKSALLGDNITGIDEYAFSGCSELESIIVPDSVKAIEQYAFSGCSGMTSVVIGNGTEAIGQSAFSGCSSMKSLVIGNATKTIGQYAFSGCSNMTSVTIGHGLKSLGQYSFQGCSNLPTITIPGSVTYISNRTFIGCKGLKEIIMADREDEVVTRTFIDRTIYYGSSIVIDVSVGDELSFNYKVNNGTLYVNMDVSTQSIMGTGTYKKVFDYAGRVTIYTDNYYSSSCDITDMKLIESGNLSLGSNDYSPLFTDCPLDSVYIGRNIAYQKGSNYGYSPFYRNTSLRSVVITDKEEEISENEFYGCTNLQNVEIGDGVTEIGNRAFSGCASLQHFGFGTQVKNIGAEAFSDCTALTAIISKAETPPVCGSQALDDVNKWECTLTVPEGSVEAYQQADQWKEFFFVEAGDENGSTPIDPTGKKCATPVITFMDGKLTFTCETEGVEYAYEVTNADVKKGHASEVAIDGTYKVSVYATKAGYQDSDVATMEFTLGAGGGSYDVNGDGKVDVADIATIISEMAARSRMQKEAEE